MSAEMNMVLDAPVCVRGVTVAALCRVTVVPVRVADGVSAWAQKEPVAILLRQGAQTKIYSPDGAVMTPDAIEALCLGAIARFEALAGASGDAGRGRPEART